MRGSLIFKAVACLLVSLPFTNCSIALETDSLEQGCPTGEKNCDGCVRIDSPAHGCSSDGCEPCPLSSHQIPYCVSGSCMHVCLDGFIGANCDQPQPPGR